jgi:hypothetical protein
VYQGVSIICGIAFCLEIVSLQGANTAKLYLNVFVKIRSALLMARVSFKEIANIYYGYLTLAALIAVTVFLVSRIGLNSKIKELKESSKNITKSPHRRFSLVTPSMSQIHHSHFMTDDPFHLCNDVHTYCMRCQPDIHDTDT